MAKPDLREFTRREREIIATCRTPRAVERWLRSLPYNSEAGGETLRSFRGVVRDGIAHCLEGALAAATILEQHGYPTLLLSFQSKDLLDHVIFPFRGRDGRWGAVARSRDPGLHGRKAVFRRPRELAASYCEPYVDLTARLVGYVVVDLSALGGYDWRLSERNVWKVERWLIETPHRKLRMAERSYRAALARYRRFKTLHPEAKPLYFDRSRWL